MAALAERLEPPARRRPARALVAPVPRAEPSCRSRSRSSGSGSSTSSSPGSRSTTCRWRVRLRGAARRRGAGSARSATSCARHEALRTTFRRATAAGRRQVIAGRACRRAADDLRVPTPAREARLRSCLGAGGAQRPFDLAHGPLLRAHAVRARGRRARAAADRCTTSSPTAGRMGVLVRELAALYAARRDGRAARRCRRCRSSTPTTPSGSASWLEGDRRSSASSRYWQRAARRARRPALELPTDRPRPAVQSFRGGSVPLSAVGATLHGAPARAGRARGRRRLFMVLLAAFAGCCWRATRARSDVVVGTPDRRPHRARARGPDRLLRQHAGAAHRRLAAIRRFRELLAPGARDRRWAPTRTRTCRSSSWSRSCSPARPEPHPLFQVMFVLQNSAPASCAGLPGPDAAPARAVATDERQVRPRR